jgi:hypothetical protein
LLVYLINIMNIINAWIMEHIKLIKHHSLNKNKLRTIRNFLKIFLKFPITKFHENEV